ncbi:hypothetical protein ACXR2W_00745 [Leucobacter sp. HY1908]
MAITYAYTGKLADFGDAPFPTAKPKLWVEPMQPAMSGGSVLAAKRVQITPASNGNFTVQLIASADLDPWSRYRLRCEWLDGDVVMGWSEWIFTALIGGGGIADMSGVVVTNVWHSASYPPVNRKNIIWIHPITGDVREWV